MWFFYILKNKKEDKIYTGSTNDVERRLIQHNRGHTTSTRRFMPWHVVYLEEYNSKKEARDRERQVKKWKNRKRTEALIARNFRPKRTGSR